MHIPAPFLFSLILTGIPLTAQEKYTLRYQLEPGKSAWVLQSQEMAQNMNMGGREMKSTTTTSMWMEGKVTEVKNGVATVEQRYARMKIKSDSPMMKTDYDSDVEGSNAGPMRSTAELVGKTAKVKVDAMGKVQDFTLPDGMDAEMEKVGVSLKQGFEQQFNSWPKDPVAVGESWKSSMEFPMGPMGSMKATVTNKLVSVKDKEVTIEQTMEMDTSGVSMPGGLKMEVTKAGGTGKYSLTSFLPIESTMSMDMKMGGGESPMSVTMTQRTTIKQIEAPAPKKPADEVKKPAEAGKTGDGK